MWVSKCIGLIVLCIVPVLRHWYIMLLCRLDMIWLLTVTCTEIQLQLTALFHHIETSLLRFSVTEDSNLSMYVLLSISTLYIREGQCLKRSRHPCISHKPPLPGFSWCLTGRCTWHIPCTGYWLDHASSVNTLLRLHKATIQTFRMIGRCK